MNSRTMITVAVRIKQFALLSRDLLFLVNPVASDRVMVHEVKGAGRN